MYDMSNQMSMDEMIEVLARYRYNAKHDADRIKSLEESLGRMRAEVDRLTNLKSEADYFKAEVDRLRASSFVTAVPVEQYERVVKAGDGLVFALESMDIIMDTNSDHPEVAEWNKAKGGKQS